MRLNRSPVAPVRPHGPLASCPAGLVKPPLKRSRSAPDGGDEETQEQLQDQTAEGSSIEEEEKTDNATLLRLLEEGEKVLGFWTGGFALSGLFPFTRQLKGIYQAAKETYCSLCSEISIKPPSGFSTLICRTFSPLRTPTSMKWHQMQD